MLRAGLIGLPAVGKTTLFRLLTAARESARRGGEAVHLGVAHVPDPRLDRLAELFAPRRKIPAAIELADLLARPTREGLLDISALRVADALLHVVRLFRDPAVPHACGSVDPVRDVRALEEELILTDLAQAERRLDRVARDIRKGVRGDLPDEAALLERCRDWLAEGRPLRTLALEPEARKRLRGFQLLSAKPLLVVLNLDERDLGRAATAAAWSGVAPLAAQASAGVVAVCAKIELELAELDPAEVPAFMAAWGLEESGLARIVRAAYGLLGYLSFFTIGEHEVRAWSVARGTTALAAAGEIHSDIARGFIRAEVVRFEHLAARGSLAACREHGELRLEGKEYTVEDGDVIYFRFAA
jgi:GTP-binding protein YchF